MFTHNRIFILCYVFLLGGVGAQMVQGAANRSTQIHSALTRISRLETTKLQIKTTQRFHKFEQWVTEMAGSRPVCSSVASETDRCRTNRTHTRQSGPDSGPGFQVGVLKTFYILPAAKLFSSSLVVPTFSVLLSFEYFPLLSSSPFSSSPLSEAVLGVPLD